MAHTYKDSIKIMLIHSITFGDTVNYPGHMATVIATQGCNKDCPYCHNQQLIPPISPTAVEYDTPPYELLRNNKLRSKYIVITGGEPTMQRDLLIFMKKLAHVGYIIKLDTNSTLVPVSVYFRHVSCVALDIKNYHQCYLRVNIVTCIVKKIPFELRFTTFGNKIKMLEKIKNLIQDIKTARYMTRLHNTDNTGIVPVYIQNSGHWKEKDTEEIYQKLCNYTQEFSLPVQIYRR